VRAAILDTSVYIDHWEHGLHQTELEAVRRMYIVRHSSVVLSELRRGARTRKAQRLIESLQRMAVVTWAPSALDWWEAGRLIRTIGDENSWDTVKRREFQNDALIGLTARRYGATVVTSNHGDFDLLGSEIGIDIHPV
jgi:predicted nucleic acid-binding protein